MVNSSGRNSLTPGKWLAAAAHILRRNCLPSRCALCAGSASMSGLCTFCTDLLGEARPNPAASCTVCALPLLARAARHNLPGNRPGEAGRAHRDDRDCAVTTLYCRDCQEHLPAYQRCIAASLYSPPCAALVNRLKHHGALYVAPALASLLANEVRARWQSDPACQRETRIGLQPTLEKPAVSLLPDAIVAVPLHPARLRERGFNQALQIARPLARQLEIPLIINACERTRETSAQQGLGRRARLANLQGCFRCDGRVANRHIAIVDDVMTTGSTADAVARSIIRAGANSCEVWCIARTPAAHNQAGIGNRDKEFAATAL